MWDAVKEAVRRMGRGGDWQCLETGFKRYAHEVLEWSKVLNLTGARSVAEIVEVHITDSVLAAMAIRAEPGMAIMDMGSGAGFPGIPVAMCLPEATVYLVESRLRRAAFLERCCRELVLRNARVVRERLETLGADPQWRGSVGVCLSRGLAPLPDVMRLAAPLVSDAGRLIVHIGPEVDGRDMCGSEGCGWRFERMEVLAGTRGQRRVAMYALRKEVEEDPARSKKN